MGERNILWLKGDFGISAKHTASVPLLHTVTTKHTTRKCDAGKRIKFQAFVPSTKLKFYNNGASCGENINNSFPLTLLAGSVNGGLLNTLKETPGTYPFMLWQHCKPKEEIKDPTLLFVLFFVAFPRIVNEKTSRRCFRLTPPDLTVPWTFLKTAWHP